MTKTDKSWYYPQCQKGIPNIMLSYDEQYFANKSSKIYCHLNWAHQTELDTTISEMIIYIRELQDWSNIFTFLNESKMAIV